jgi:4'-phosphopantetheinyl transferase EntD
VKVKPNSLTLSLSLDLEPIIPSTQSLEVAITTVIERKINNLISKQDAITYWALTHVAKEADFHQRKSFILNL